MSPVQRPELPSVEDFLTAEAGSSVKHEYVGGVVYAMAGGTISHNLIASNVLVALGRRLRGKPCRAFNSDMKIRLRLPTHVRFYYPDASVICRSNPPESSFQDEPAVIVEVVSEATRRTDEEGKKEAYLTIPSLAVYVILEQDARSAVAFRRTEHGFVREVYAGDQAIIPLEEVDAELPLSEVYEGVELTDGSPA